MNGRLPLLVTAAVVPMIIFGVGTGSVMPGAFAAHQEVCGLQLCSEIEGGWDAWTASMSDDDDAGAGGPDVPKSIGIPLHKGYYDGWAVYYIITDSSEMTHAEVIEESQGWPVQYSPALAMAPAEARSNTYMFTNGVPGSGVHGFQAEVFTSAPGRDTDYSPLTGHVHVIWNTNAIPKILDSEAAIMTAADAGDLELVEVDVVINMPRFVVSPAQSEMLDRMQERTMTLPVHSGFYDGERVYGLILDSNSRETANTITLLRSFESNYSPNLGEAVTSQDGGAASNVYVFTNGIKGGGIHGFQDQVFASGLGSDLYTPVASFVSVTWGDDAEPRVLASESEIMNAAAAGDVVLDGADGDGGDAITVTNMPLVVLDGMDDDTMMAMQDMTDDMLGVIVPPSTEDEMSSDTDAGSKDDDDKVMMEDDDKVMMEDDDKVMMEDDDKVMMEAAAEDAPELRLARASIEVDIPLRMGHYDGQDVYYVITDASDEVHAGIISEDQGWRVEMAPFLASAPPESLSAAYMFTNGVPGSGIHGFQPEVFAAIPGSDAYSALAAPLHVMWNDGATPRTLDSEAAILDAADAGDVTLDPLDIVINMPHIVWPGGQMAIKSGTIDDASPYGGGQVTDIDTDDMTVTFVAHRGWGPDGRTIYYIVTDATPSGPAEMMGVVGADTSASLITNPAAVDLYQFANGIPGPGPLGYQPGIASAALGDPGYSPMWRIYIIQWNNPAEDARLLQTVSDIGAYLDEGLITVTLARPMNSDHIVNCPFVDPFQ